MDYTPPGFNSAADMSSFQQQHIPKMMAGQLGFKQQNYHRQPHHNYQQPHQSNNTSSYHQYSSYQQAPHHINYYSTSKSHSRAPSIAKHAPQQQMNNLHEETRASLNKIRKTELLSYAPKFIEKTFLCDPLPPPSFSNQILLPAFLLNIMNRTRINTCTLTAAFLYLDRLKQLHPRCKGSPGSGHRLMLAAIVLAAKYMYDDTFDNTAWATVSSGLFELEQVNHMEREMLSFLDFKLFIKTQEWYQFTDRLWVEMNEGMSFSPVAPLPSPSLTLPNRSQNSSASFSRQNSFSRQDSFPRPGFSRQDSAITVIDPTPIAPIIRQNGWIPEKSTQQHAFSHSGVVNYATYGHQAWLRSDDYNFQ